MLSFALSSLFGAAVWSRGNADPGWLVDGVAVALTVGPLARNTS